MNEHNMSDRRLLFRWVRATWTGWVLGLPLIITMALVGEAIGIEGAQVFVGAGMGRESDSYRGTPYGVCCINLLSGSGHASVDSQRLSL